MLLSGGTSKGAGDLSYRVLARRTPGIVVHGVALKPGKPICLGAVGTTPVAILPGFPTSAIFTFHEFVAPLIRLLAGARAEAREAVAARMPVRFNSEGGRTEYLLVNLVRGPDGLGAYPMGKGSGSVTTFSQADGFVVIPRAREYLEAGEEVAVVPLGRGTAPADLVVDRLALRRASTSCSAGSTTGGITSKTIWVGSQGGLLAAGRGECDLAGVHLLDPKTDVYNRPFLPEGVRLLAGYGRMQGVVFRPGDPRFEGGAVAEAIARAAGRSRLPDGQPQPGERDARPDRRPPGEAGGRRATRSRRGRTTRSPRPWRRAGPTGAWRSRPVAALYGLAFLPVRQERYDFAIPESPLGPPGRRRLPRPPRTARGPSRPGRPRLPPRRGPRMTVGADRPLRRPEPPDGPAQGVAPLRPRADAPARRAARRRGGPPDRRRRRARSGPPPLPDWASIVRDPVAGRGPLQGLAAGLAALPDSVELAYATATDVPFLQPAWIHRLVDLIGDHDLAIPFVEGYHHPLAALYRRATVLPAIEALLAADRLRPVFLIESVRPLVVGPEELREVDPDLRTLRNLNTPEDYQTALEEWQSGTSPPESAPMADHSSTCFLRKRRYPK